MDFSRTSLMPFVLLSLVLWHGMSAQVARLLTASQALSQIRPAGTLTVPQLQSLIRNAIPGVSYPVLSRIPPTSFRCDSVGGTGYYADPDTDCQVYRHCIPDGRMYSYLCPNKTIFNQVTLVCDWWYNVDCTKAASFWEYTNPRIYEQNLLLLDDGDQTFSMPRRPRTTPPPLLPGRFVETEHSLLNSYGVSQWGFGTGQLNNDQSDFHGIMNQHSSPKLDDFHGFMSERTTPRFTTALPNRLSGIIDQEANQLAESIVFLTNSTARTLLPMAQGRTTPNPQQPVLQSRKPGLKLLYGRMKDSNGNDKDRKLTQAKQRFVSFIAPRPQEEASESDTVTVGPWVITTRKDQIVSNEGLQPQQTRAESSSGAIVDRDVDADQESVSFASKGIVKAIDERSRKLFGNVKSVSNMEQSALPSSFFG